MLHPTSRVGALPSLVESGEQAQLIPEPEAAIAADLSVAVEPLQALQAAEGTDGAPVENTGETAVAQFPLANMPGQQQVLPVVALAHGMGAAPVVPNGNPDGDSPSDSSDDEDGLGVSTACWSLLT